MSECHVLVTGGGAVGGNYCPPSSPHPTSAPQAHLLPTAVSVTASPAAAPVAATTTTTVQVPPSPEPLAYTGIDVGVIGIVGTALLAVGVVLARLGRSGASS